MTVRTVYELIVAIVVRCCGIVLVRCCIIIVAVVFATGCCLILLVVSHLREGCVFSFGSALCLLPNN